MSIEKIKQAVRDIPDFPKLGIVFKDITPVLHDPELFAQTIKIFAEKYRGTPITRIAGIDARGFIFGAALAYELGLGFIPIRKKGKLPHDAYEVSYDLEYGTSTIEMHTDAVEEGDRVLIVDDLLATGGTARAAADLIEKSGGTVEALAFLVELGFLKGRAQLDGYHIFVPITY